MRLNKKEMNVAFTTLDSKSLDKNDKIKVTEHLLGNGVLSLNERIYRTNEGVVVVSLKDGEREVYTDKKFIRQFVKQKLYWTQDYMIDELLAIREVYEPKLIEGLAPKKYEMNLCVTPNLTENISNIPLDKVEIGENIQKLLNNIVPTKTEQEYLLIWFANALQLNRNRTAIILKGHTEGTGKGIFNKHIASWAFGEANSTTFESEEILSIYNGRMENNLFCCLNEIAIEGKETIVIEKMKSWITDPELKIRNMRVGGRIVRNYNNFLVFSNQSKPVDVSITDRRYSIFSTSEFPLTDICNTAKLIEGIKQERQKFVLGLCNLDSKLFSMVDKPMMTETKKEVVSETIGSHEELLQTVKNRDLDLLHTMLTDALAQPLGQRDLADRQALMYNTNLFQIMEDVESEFRQKYISTNKLQLLHSLIYGVVTKRYLAKLYNTLNPIKVKKVNGKTIRVRPL